MQTNNRLFEDLARVASGAVSTLVGIKDELEAMMRQQIERFLTDADMVPREEFDAVKAMAQKARGEQEILATRVAALETALGAKQPRAAATKKKAASAKKKPVSARKAAGTRTKS